MRRYYATRDLRDIARRLRGRPAYPSRYEALYEEIRARGAARILEVGTNDGRNARRMIAAARAGGARRVTYAGFDLFETQDRAQRLSEFSIATRTLDQVEVFLRASGAEVRLIPGDSRTTVPREAPALAPWDIVFIDGGHSLETVRSDWDAVRPHLRPDTSVYFDDYPQWGVGPLVDCIDSRAWEVSILPTADVHARVPDLHGPGPQTIAFQLARVRLRTPSPGHKRASA